jgi:hypothetical protein
VGGPAERREGVLERLDAGAADEALALDDLGERPIELVPEAGVLTAEVDERDAHSSPQ